ncbi:excinuclease ABC subunit UvrC [Candidatus Nomurabacteria bacterium]|nr:excinuclease ABC subunit UvrC [Candidatus Nomurabacteria bacterium]
MEQRIQELIDLIPRRTGVYKFYDQNGELLYIGKALNLNSRVTSYFRQDHTDRPHIIPMIPKIYNIEYIETENEVEALVLESALVHKQQPKYNVMLKDDKSYAWIYISTHEKVPRIEIVRSIDPKSFKNGRLFGPYPSGRAVLQVFRYIRKLYPFCTCKNPKEPCLYYHMGLCPGPHFDYISHEEYMKNIGEIIKFLQGKKKRHVSGIEKEMKLAASEEDFEKAAELRDKLQDLRHLSGGFKFSYLNSEREFKESRYKMVLSELESIKSDLGIGSVARIECYDISNIQGEDAYGSMVVSIDGIPKHSEYRVFKIKSKDTPDDFEMLHEVLSRRIKHIGNPKSDESLSMKPDIILIDGGKGQLSAVRDVVPKDTFLLGISKGRHLKRKGKRKEDQFWVLRGKISLMIKINSPRILINLRDEAHRFALKHHRNARKFRKKKSMLDSIKGVGAKRKKKLIERFGSLDEIRKASIKEIDSVVKNTALAEKIAKSLKN